MILDRIFALLTVVGLGLFLWVPFNRVVDWPLRIVLILTVLAAAYDFWSTLNRRRKNRQS